MNQKGPHFEKLPVLDITYMGTYVYQRFRRLLQPVFTPMCLLPRSPWSVSLKGRGKTAGFCCKLSESPHVSSTASTGMKYVRRSWATHTLPVRSPLPKRQPSTRSAPGPQTFAPESSFGCGSRPCEHQNTCQMDVHPPQNGAIGYAPWPFWVCLPLATIQLARNWAAIAVSKRENYRRVDCTKRRRRPPPAVFP